MASANREHRDRRALLVGCRGRRTKPGEPDRSETLCLAGPGRSASPMKRTTTAVAVGLDRTETSCPAGPGRSVRHRSMRTTVVAVGLGQSARHRSIANCQYEHERRSMRAGKNTARVVGIWRPCAISRGSTHPYDGRAGSAREGTDELKVSGRAGSKDERDEPMAPGRLPRLDEKLPEDPRFMRSGIAEPGRCCMVSGRPAAGRLGQVAQREDQGGRESPRFGRSF